MTQALPRVNSSVAMAAPQKSQWADASCPISLFPQSSARVRSGEGHLIVTHTGNIIASNMGYFLGAPPAGGGDRASGRSLVRKTALVLIGLGRVDRRHLGTEDHAADALVVPDLELDVE